MAAWIPADTFEGCVQSDGDCVAADLQIAHDAKPVTFLLVGTFDASAAKDDLGVALDIQKIRGS